MNHKSGPTKTENDKNDKNSKNNQTSPEKVAAPGSTPARHPRIGVIGAGNWGRNHVKTLHKLGALAAVADAGTAVRAEIEKTYPGIKVYAHHHDLLAGDTVDAVIVATPAFTHCAVSCDALRAGKDVLVEKPMAMNLAEADELIALAENGGRILMVGHLLLYSPAIRAIAEIIRNGEIGDIIHLELRRLKLGRVRREENVLWSFAPHDLAVMLHLTDSEVTSVSAAGLKALQPHIEDDVHVHITFQNGARAHVHASWLWPEVERKTVIAGTAGMIIYDEYKNEARLYRKSINKELEIQDEGSREITFDKTAALLDLEDGHFIECVRNRTAPFTGVAGGRKVIDLLTRADRELNPTGHRDGSPDR